MNALRLARSIVHRYRLQRYARQVGSYEWATRLFAANLPTLRAQAAVSNELLLPDLQLTISADHLFVLESYSNLMDLRSSGFHLAAAGRGEIDARNETLRVRLNSVEEVFIMKEVFSSRVYDIAPADDAFIVDIGMNVGFASLFFAACWPGAHIEAFEPFPATFMRAQFQLSLNPELAARINPNPFGLWKIDEQLTVKYRAESKGATGLWGVQGNDCVGADPNAHDQDLVLRDVAAVLGPLLSSVDSRLKVLKIDCEGSEYAIFDRLAETGLADRFDVILMEWHRLDPTHDPRRLRSLLTRCGYLSVCPCDMNGPVGMIYAYRQRPQSRGSGIS